MSAATAYRIMENNALLAAFEAVTDHASFWPAFVAVEHAINTDDVNGRWDEADRVRAEFNRIHRALRPMLDAQYNVNALAAVTSRVLSDIGASVGVQMMDAAE